MTTAMSGMKRTVVIVAGCLALAFVPGVAFARDFDIRDYGARGDGKSLNTTWLGYCNPIPDMAQYAP